VARVSEAAAPAAAATTRVLIVDDEPVARRGARRVVEARPDACVVGECRSGTEAVRAILELAPDVVLLDVQMPGLDGLGVVREVGAERMPAVVFVTAYDEFAVRAFEVAAVDYVVKPYTDERLARALDRALERRAERRAAGLQRQLLALLGGGGAVRAASATGAGAPPHDHDGADPAAARNRNVPAAPWLSRLLVTVGTRSIVVPVGEVTWIRADDYYASVFTGGTAYLLREPLTDLERRLDPREFLRVHRSAIVRLAAVRALERTAQGRLVVLLRDGTRVPVSRARRDAVVGALGDARG
jgi:two-component system LytT family response regulator